MSCSTAARGDIAFSVEDAPRVLIASEDSDAALEVFKGRSPTGSASDEEARLVAVELEREGVLKHVELRNIGLIIEVEQRPEAA